MDPSRHARRARLVRSARRGPRALRGSPPGAAWPASPSSSWACDSATGSALARASTRTAWPSRAGPPSASASSSSARSRRGRSRATRARGSSGCRDDGALVNRMGFNNAGAEALAGRIADARPRLPDGFVVGVNIGRNRDGDDRRLSPPRRARWPRWPTTSRSTSARPNTAGPARPRGPGAAARAARHGSVGRAGRAARWSSCRPTSPTIAAPRSSARCPRRTRRRDPQQHHHHPGRPRFSRRGRGRRAVRPPAAAAHAWRPSEESRRVGGRDIAIVASGGIGSGADVAAALEAGADLVQLWTGMIYAGPGLIGRCRSGPARMRRSSQGARAGRAAPTTECTTL